MIHNKKIKDKKIKDEIPTASTEKIRAMLGNKTPKEFHDS